MLLGGNEREVNENRTLGCVAGISERVFLRDPLHPNRTMESYKKLPDMQPPPSPTSPSKKGSFKKAIRRMISSSSSSKSSSPASPSTSKNCKFFSTEVLDESGPSSTKSSPRSYRPNSIDQSLLRPQSQGSNVRSLHLPKEQAASAKRRITPAKYQLPSKTEVTQRKDVEHRVKGGFIIFCRYESTIMMSPAISSQNGKGDSPSAVNSPSKLSASSVGGHAAPPSGGSSWTAWWRIFKLANLLMQQGC